MRIAKDLHDRNMAAFPMKLNESPYANEMNVANVCVGYAFELAYKALVEAGERKPREWTHSLRHAHNHLSSEIRIKTEQVIVTNGWKTVDAFLNHFDDNICHTRCRYWMRPKSPPLAGDTARHQVWFGYPAGIDSLAKLHEGLLDLYDELGKGDSKA